MKFNLTDKLKDHLQGTDVQSLHKLDYEKKSFLLSVFSYLLSGLMLILLVLAFVDGNTLHLVSGSVTLLLVWAFYYLFRYKKQLALGVNGFVVLICVIGWFFLLTGGFRQTGIISVALVPLPVIILLGRKTGFLVLSFFLLSSVALLILFRNTTWVAHYDYSLLVGASSSFFIITILTSLNEAVFDVLYAHLHTTVLSLKASQDKYIELALIRERILSLVSRDLKTQTETLRETSNHLYDQYEKMTEPERKDVVTMLCESSQQNSHLLQDLLKWAMIKNQSFPYQPVNVKLERIYRDVFELFQTEIEQKNISVFLKVKSNSEVYADYDMLSAVIRNLVSNALKFSHPKGEIRIVSEEKGDFMVVKVKDKGAGMSESALELLRKSISSPLTGGPEVRTGYGLILVHEFIHTNKGEMTITSELNKGTTVCFTIPLAD